MVTHQQWKNADTRNGPGPPRRDELHPGVTEPGIHDVGGITGTTGERLSVDVEMINPGARKIRTA
ncbi:MAG: hypothetical protein ACLFR8_14120 [Alkalispirochaeta sp.]